MASPAFLSSSGWALTKTGHMLGEKPLGAEYVAITVVKVLDYKLFCGPMGNYNEKFKDNSPLEKAKYTFTIGKPDEAAFHTNYNLTFSSLEKIQTSISFDRDQQNMLDPLAKTIRFSCPIFVERVGHPTYNHPSTDYYLISPFLFIGPCPMQMTPACLPPVPP
jgi:hypothetical protein